MADLYTLLAPTILTDRFIDAHILAELAKNEARDKARDNHKCESHRDKYRIVTDAVCRRQLRLRDDKDGLEPADRFVRLSFAILASMIGKDYTHEILENMVKWGWLERRGQYIPKVKSYEYRLGSALRGLRHIDWMVMNDRLDAKLVKRRAAIKASQRKANELEQTIEKAGLDRLRLSLLDNLRKLEIDHEAALDHIAGKLLATYQISSAEHVSVWYHQSISQSPAWLLVKHQPEHLKRSKLHQQLTKQLVHQHLIAQKRGDFDGNVMEFRTALKRNEALQKAVAGYYTLQQFEFDQETIRAWSEGSLYCVRRKNVRVDTNLTNLTSDLRQFLRHEAGPLVNLDIANSQPLLLAGLIQRHYAGKPLPEDVESYILLCQCGHLYEEMMHQLQIPAEQRKDFKQSMFAEVFYGKNDTVTKRTRAFEYLFPNVFAFILAKKRKNYKALPLEMQELEADLMIDRVVEQLLEAGIWCSTIHDSIVCLEQDAERVQRVLLAVYRKQVNLQPLVKPELLANKPVGHDQPLVHEVGSSFVDESGQLQTLEGLTLATGVATGAELNGQSVKETVIDVVKVSASLPTTPTWVGPGLDPFDDLEGW